MSGSVIVINASASAVTAKASFSIFSQFINAFSESAEVVFEIKGENYSYQRKNLFFSTESGASLKLVVRGKPVAVKYIMERLTGEEISEETSDDEIYIDEETIIKKIRQRAGELQGSGTLRPEKMYVSKMAFIKDLFSANTRLELDIRGRNYYRSTKFLYHEESGPKMKIKISGRPQFAQAMVDHLNLFSPRLEKIFRYLD